MRTKDFIRIAATAGVIIATVIAGLSAFTNYLPTSRWSPLTGIIILLSIYVACGGLYKFAGERLDE